MRIFKWISTKIKDAIAKHKENNNIFILRDKIEEKKYQCACKYSQERTVILCIIPGPWKPEIKKSIKEGGLSYIDIDKAKYSIKGAKYADLIRSNIGKYNMIICKATVKNMRHISKSIGTKKDCEAYWIMPEDFDKYIGYITSKNFIKDASYIEANKEVMESIISKSKIPTYKVIGSKNININDERISNRKRDNIPWL